MLNAIQNAMQNIMHSTMQKRYVSTIQIQWKHKYSELHHLKTFEGLKRVSAQN